MREIKAVIRKDRVDDVVHALREAGVTRLWTSHVHAVGSGVDPSEAHLSLEEGGEFMEKAKLELFCRPEDVDAIVTLVRDRAGTGHRGDGVIAVTALDRCVSVRTGDEERLAVV